MFSAIYQGKFRHRRLYPKAHAFSYESTLFYLDLDELPQLFKGVKGWSLEGTARGQFCRRDYLGDPDTELKEAVRAEVVHQWGHCPQGPVRMLTNLRMWGFCFNPVTLYYLFEPSVEKPALILAQVNNTPWNKRHSYIVPCDDGGKTRTDFPKQFHVSPFNPLDMRYHWVSTSPSEKLLVHMENHREGICHMDATLTLERQGWSAEQLQRILWRQPWLTLKVPAMIYWQALKLFLKGVPFYPHRSLRDEEKHNPSLPTVAQRDMTNR